MDHGQSATLVLEDGTIFQGTAFGADRAVAGEVVFSTGLTGYPESLTDPSYRGQILVLTYPLIGNYGVPDRSARDGVLTHFESDHIQVAGLVVSTVSRTPNHWTSVASLDEWLLAEGVPALEGIDTRAVTQRLRVHGVMGGRMLSNSATCAGPLIDMRHVVADVSVSVPQLLRSSGGHGLTIGVLDCGVKNNILRLLLERGVDVLRLPYDADPCRTSPRLDGLVISNGPGDPKDAPRAVDMTRRAIDNRLPTFGICFGNQIMALAVGADTYKMPFGHRGQNQPCIDLGTGRCFITSQNHGYSVDEATLPSDWEPWFRNANDGTNEGIRHASLPFSAVQFHPEAHPGPEDVRFLVDEFLDGLE